MKFNERLIRLRKEKGYSQEELGNLINVTRQTISNWELGISTPELEKIVSLADVFNITTDSLLCVDDLEGNKKSINIIHNDFHYEYKSNKSIKGIPLVHINIGFGMKKAKGIIAIGNIATGVVAIGGISLGVVSLGGLALGLLALGGFSLALFFALGGFAIGTVSLGGIALGIFAIGGIAIGVYSIGGAAIASEIGYGGYATGKAAFDLENNQKTFSANEIKSLIESKCPYTWEFIKNIFISLGKK
ncbi:MAG: helix-turn-helix transcriptional regulator [Erysipelotrichales bacterium]|nr:helix-turn-helix transcriptional regulator [Erysipelotrichales bacterium]